MVEYVDKVIQILRDKLNDITRNEGRTAKELGVNDKKRAYIRELIEQIETYRKWHNKKQKND